MEIGHFYYIDDQYFKDFPDSYLMQNKEKVNGQLHDAIHKRTTRPLSEAADVRWTQAVVSYAHTVE